MATTEQIIDNLISLAKVASKAEHKPGKIVLSISNAKIPSLVSTLGGISIEDEVKRIPGYDGHRIRPGLLKTSVEIDYDKDKIPFDLWESLMNVSAAPQTADSVIDGLKKLFRS